MDINQLLQIPGFEQEQPMEQGMGLGVLSPEYLEMLSSQNQDISGEVSTKTKQAMPREVGQVIQNIIQPSKAPMSQQIFQMLTERSTKGLDQQREMASEYDDAANKFAGTKAQMDLTPLLMAADWLSGGDTQSAKLYKAPKSQQEIDAASLAMKSQSAKNWGSLTNDEISLLKSQYQNAADSEKLGMMEKLARMKISAKEDGKGEELTPGQKKLDQTFASEYADWDKQGGYASVDKQLKQLEDAADMLEKDDTISGPARGSTPDMIRAFTNPNALNVRDNVRGALQGALKQTLGSAFTDKEGQRVEARGYNEKLPGKTNAERIRAEVKRIREMAKAKQASGDHFEQYGTLKGQGSVKGASKAPSFEEWKKSRGNK